VESVLPQCFRLECCFTFADDYARAASQGFRPERTKDIQDDVWQLITMCWDQDPLERPTMDVVVARLEDICDKARTVATEVFIFVSSQAI